MNKNPQIVSDLDMSALLGIVTTMRMACRYLFFNSAIWWVTLFSDRNFLTAVLLKQSHPVGMWV